MQSNNPWGTFVSQLQSAAASETPKRKCFNPRPPGVIQPGGASEAVFTLLGSKPNAFFTHAQIQAATGKSKVAVDWALIFLKSTGRIEAYVDAHRNDRYLKYRVAR